MKPSLQHITHVYHTADVCLAFGTTFSSAHIVFIYSQLQWVHVMA